MRVVRHRIFTPLRMRTSSIQHRRASQAGGCIDAARDQRRGSPNRFRGGTSTMSGPAGSINSNVAEMAQYVRMQLGNGTYNGTKLVSRRRISTSPRLRTSHRRGTATASPLLRAYGLGWVLPTIAGNGSRGTTAGSTGCCRMWTVPEIGLGIVVLTNGSPHSAGGPTDRAGTSSTGFLVGAPPRTVSARAQATPAGGQATAAQRKQRKSERAQGQPPVAAARRYAGTYHDPMYGDFTAERRGGPSGRRFQWIRPGRLDPLALQHLPRRPAAVDHRRLAPS